MRRIALALLALGDSRALRLPSRLIDRRKALASLGGCCALAFNGAATASGAAAIPKEGFIFEEDLKDGLSPAVRMLRIIEQTEYLEQMLRKSAALSKEDRFAQGLQVGPDQLKTSIDLLMRNSQLGELLACAPAVRTLDGIKALASRRGNKLMPADMLQAADQYVVARGQVPQLAVYTSLCADACTLSLRAPRLAGEAGVRAAATGGADGRDRARGQAARVGGRARAQGQGGGCARPGLREVLGGAEAGRRRVGGAPAAARAADKRERALAGGRAAGALWRQAEGGDLSFQGMATVAVGAET